MNKTQWALAAYAALATILIVLLALENHNLKNPVPLAADAIDFENAYAIELGAAPMLGPEDAPVTMVIFSDYECTYCRNGLDSLNRLRKEYGSQLRLVVKQFPLASHPFARTAAHAALAADRQDRFWDMHELLFYIQDDLSDEGILEAASFLQLDMDRFRADLSPGHWETRLDEELRQGRALGVQGTPTVFVNGVRVPGMDYAQLKSVIDRFLDESSSAG